MRKNSTRFKSGVRCNLATALIHEAQTNSAKRGDNFTEVELLLNTLLAKQPNEPKSLNAKAIFLREKDDGGRRSGRNGADAKHLFQRAAEQYYLPAQFNLAIAQIDNGHTKEGIAPGPIPSIRFFEPLGTIARAALKSEHVDPPPLPPPSKALASSILGVRLGTTSEQVMAILKKPERIVQCATTDGSAGEIYWYYSGAHAGTL